MCPESFIFYNHSALGDRGQWVLRDWWIIRGEQHMIWFAHSCCAVKFASKIMSTHSVWMASTFTIHSVLNSQSHTESKHCSDLFAVNITLCLCLYFLYVMVCVDRVCSEIRTMGGERETSALSPQECPVSANNHMIVWDITESWWQ